MQASEKSDTRSSDQTPSHGYAGTRWQALGGVLITLLVLAAVLIAIFSGGSVTQLRPGRPVPSEHEVHKMLAGIPQRDQELGDPRAPLELLEFGDLQCPACAHFALGALPGIISRYVRSGKLMIVFEPLHFIGGDSLRAAQMALALGEQDHLWDFTELMYRNQGVENSSYVTDTYLAALASAIPAVNVNEAMKVRSSPRIRDLLERASALAHKFHIQYTPSFLLSAHGGVMHLLQPAHFSESSSFIEPLDHALAQSSR